MKSLHIRIRIDDASMVSPPSQYFINKVLGKNLGKYVLIRFYHILTCSNIWKECMHHLGTMLTVLTEKNLHAKSSK